MITYGAIGRLVGVDVLAPAGALQVGHGRCSDRGFLVRLADGLRTVDRSVTPGGRKGPQFGGLG